MKFFSLVQHLIIKRKKKYQIILCYVVFRNIVIMCYIVYKCFYYIVINYNIILGKSCIDSKAYII